MPRYRQRGRPAADYPDQADYSDYSDYSDGGYSPPRKQGLRARSRSKLESLAQHLERSIGLDGSRSRSRSRSHSRSRPPARPVRPPHHRARASSADDYYATRGRRTSRPHYYSDASSSRPPPRRRHQSTSNAARSRSRWRDAAMAGLSTAAVEARRLHRQPGSWTGAKGARVATAALGAAAMDAFMIGDGGDPSHHSKTRKVESALGGLLLNRVVNGPRDDLRRGSRR